MKVGAGVGQAVVVGPRRTVAPCKRVCAGGGIDGGVSIARVTLDPGEDVEGIGVREGVGAALGGGPDLVK